MCQAKGSPARGNIGSDIRFDRIESIENDDELLLPFTPELNGSFLFEYLKSRKYLVGVAIALMQLRNWSGQ